ncbi:MAG: methyltransferase domain-containing protein [Patescibacteria group bacterium]|nr:methyltransferase domain-containing protein [Patescibacteria group bacterium]
MNYAFILGTHPTWSVAELLAVLGEKETFWENERIFVKKDIEINAENLINNLGGVLKIAEIELELPINTAIPDLAKKCTKLLIDKASRGEGKLVFGLSDQGVGSHIQVEKLGLNIKKELKSADISSRLVTSREKELSSVVVGQNKLLSKGAELILYRREQTLVIARTLAIQPYKELSRRDFGRPVRDDHSGMLPPKLAQMMINFAGQMSPDGLLLDAFCGSGTVINEAMLMGYTNLMGTDLSEKAIKDSRINAEWLRELYNLETRAKFHIKNATRLDQFIKPKTVDSIITEPYLGPQRGLSDIDEVCAELADLYSRALDNFYNILKNDGRLVMVWPVFFGNKFIEANLDKWQVPNLLPEKLQDLPWCKLSQRGTLLYHRDGQKVWRELIVLEKINKNI